MKTSWLLKSSTKSTLITIIITVLISACSSENSAAAAHSNASQNGIDNSAKTKVNNTNQPALISGTDTGSVTEDLDNDGDGLLNASGKLNISDSDTGESVFITETINSSYGSLAIDETGNWNYGANNSLDIIQNLNNNETLSDGLTVSSVDGTTHTVTITINGTDETSGSGTSGGSTPDTTEDPATVPPPPETNSAAIISGTDTGSVTEDNDPDSDNLLETAGKLNITDADSGEASFLSKTINSNYGSLTISTDGNWNYGADNNQTVIQNLTDTDSLTDHFTISSVDGTTHTITMTINGANEANQSAVISGADTGSVTEDNDPDGDNVLEVTGKLDITDADTGEAAFIAKTHAGNFGSIIISTDGNWNYGADNNQAAIQDLLNSDSITDSFTISSIDGTTHDVVITIYGADEINTTTADITLSWVAPAEREDNSAISLSEIAGYKIYYDTVQGSYNNSIDINDGTAVGHTFTGFPTGTYYFVITTQDTEGRESQLSSEVIIVI